MMSGSLGSGCRELALTSLRMLSCVGWRPMSLPLFSVSIVIPKMWEATPSPTNGRFATVTIGDRVVSHESRGIARRPRNELTAQGGGW